MNAGKPKDQSLAIAYSVQRKNKRKMTKGGLLSAETEKRATADDQRYAEGGTVRAGSERPTADSGEEHVCNAMCSDNDHRDLAGNIVRAGSERASADSHQSQLSSTRPTTGGMDRRAGSSPVSADSGERTNAAPVRKVAGGTNVRAGSQRPTADYSEGTNAKFAFGGDVEDEDMSTHDGTLAEAIAKRLAKHLLMAEGGDVRDPDLDNDSIEHGNSLDDLNFDALGKENYDEDQLSDQPEDSNLHGDMEEKDSEDKDDGSIISKIRARNKKKM